MWTEQECPGSCKCTWKTAIQISLAWRQGTRTLLAWGHARWRPLRGLQPTSRDGWPSVFCCRRNSQRLSTVILQDNSSLTRGKRPRRGKATSNYGWQPKSMFNFFSLPSFLSFFIFDTCRRKPAFTEYLWCARHNTVGWETLSLFFRWEYWG